MMFYFDTRNVAARLERKSFCEEERRTKDWEWKAEMSAIKKYNIEQIYLLK